MINELYSKTTVRLLYIVCMREEANKLFFKILKQLVLEKKYLLPIWAYTTILEHTLKVFPIYLVIMIALIIILVIY